MKLRQGIIRPGIVVEVLDNNTIRAGAPGLFDRNDKDKLPIILPWPCGINKNSYSQINELDEVWVVNFSDNPLQLYWFRKDDVNDNKDIISEENVEILCNREAGMGWATIYFSDGSGWVIRNSDSKIQIRPDGSILMDTNIPHRAIDVNMGSISLGSVGGSKSPAVYGDELMEVLVKIQVALNIIKQSANMSPYTKPIAIALKSLPSQIEKLIPKIISPNVTLD